MFCIHLSHTREPQTAITPQDTQWFLPSNVLSTPPSCLVYKSTTLLVQTTQRNPPSSASGLYWDRDYFLHGFMMFCIYLSHTREPQTAIIPQDTQTCFCPVTYSLHLPPALSTNPPPYLFRLHSEIPHHQHQDCIGTGTTFSMDS